MKRFADAGIPSNKIAWIDDADSAVKKQALFAKVYESAQGAAGAQGAGPDMSGAQPGPDMNGAAGAKNDDVVDGDYREV